MRILPFSLIGPAVVLQALCGTSSDPQMASDVSGEAPRRRNHHSRSLRSRRRMRTLLLVALALSLVALVPGEATATPPLPGVWLCVGGVVSAGLSCALGEVCVEI